MKNNFEGKKAFVWVRKSKKGQSIYSQDGQKKDCLKWAEKEGLVIQEENIFVINETASKHKLRKEFENLIQTAKDRKIDIIYIWTVDRLSRNMESGGQIENLIKENNVFIRVVEWDEFCLTKSSSPDDWKKFLEAIIQGDYECRKISRRTKLAQGEKIDQKSYPKGAPIGYKNIIDPTDDNPDERKRRKLIIKDEERWRLVVEVFEKYSTGNYSIKSLTKEMRKRGLTTQESKTKKRPSHLVEIANIRDILRNPFYYGEFKWNGILYPHSHDPIISKELFDKVQKILDEKAVTLGCSRRASETFRFKKFLQCVCGSRFTANITDGKYKYYICWKAKEEQCKEKNYREEAVDSLIVEGIGNIRLGKKAVEEIRAMLMKADDKQDKDEEKNRKKLLANIEGEKARLKKAARVLMDDSAKDVSIEIYKQLEEEVTENIKNWQAEINKLAKTNKTFKADGVALLEILKNLKEAYKRQDREGRIRILEILMDKAILKDGKLYGIIWKEPWSLYLNLFQHFEEPEEPNLDTSSFGIDRPQRSGWKPAPLSGRKMDCLHGL